MFNRCPFGKTTGTSQCDFDDSLNAALTSFGKNAPPSALIGKTAFGKSVHFNNEKRRDARNSIG